MNNFIPLVAKMHLLKQQEAECDAVAAETWHLPRVAATEMQLAELNSVDFAFSDSYLEFFRAANGWKYFCIFTDVFSIEEACIQERHEEVFLRDGFSEYLTSIDLRRSDLFVIGSADRDADVFLLISGNAPVLRGGVIWYALQEVEVFESFYEFFLYMIEMQARLTKRACTRN